MGLKSNAAAVLVGATLLGGVGIASASSSSGSSTAANTATAPANSAAVTSCGIGHDGEWPDLVNGRPAGMDAGDSRGVYLWHDSDGWHLRVTHHGDNARVYTGVIATSGQITAQRVADERDDKIVIGPNDHVLAFRFVNYGGIDGVDFHTSCAPRISFDFKTDGHQLGTERVFLGHRAANPTSNPFVIERAN